MYSSRVGRIGFGCWYWVRRQALILSMQYGDTCNSDFISLASGWRHQSTKGSYTALQVSGSEQARENCVVLLNQQGWLCFSCPCKSCT